MVYSAGAGLGVLVCQGCLPGLASLDVSSRLSGFGD